LAPAHTRRLAHTYGTLAFQVLGDSQRLEDLGRLFGSSLSAKEVDYLMDREWAQTAEDVLHRRTKLYLHTNADDAAALEDYMARRDRPHTAASASASVSASASASA
jgi:glycerol-3-phosphate dehydrogenase